MITPIIMAGGAGTRLWPASRESMPKQLIPLFGERSTFQETLARVADANLFACPIVITSSDFRFLVAEQARAVGVKPDIMLEPTRRDSGPAVAVAAMLAANRSPDVVVPVLAADHSMPDHGAFCKACRDAVAAAKAGHIVTFGVKPTGPATSYGYLRQGKETGLGPVRKLAAFVEKPDAVEAPE